MGLRARARPRWAQLQCVSLVRACMQNDTQRDVNVTSLSLWQCSAGLELLIQSPGRNGGRVLHSMA